MEKTKINVNNKFVKFLLVLKKFWYVSLAMILVFGVAGYVVGNKKSVVSISSSKKTNNIILRTSILISDGNYQDFSDTFNNACFYFMKSNEIR